MNKLVRSCLVGAAFALLVPSIALAAGPSGDISKLANLSATTAQVDASVTPGSNTGLTYSVAYAVGTSDWCTGGGNSGSHSSTPQRTLNVDSFKSRHVSVRLNGLETGTVYCAAMDVDGNISPQWFIRAGAPNVSKFVSGVPLSSSRERITGHVDPLGKPATYSLEWGLLNGAWCTSSGAMGSPQTQAGGNLGSATTERQVTVQLGGLTAGKAYCAAIVATNDAGSSVAFPSGELSPFYFSAGKPHVSTQPASSVGRSGATLHGTLNVSGDTRPEYFFVWDKAGSPLCRTGRVPQNSAWTFNAGTPVHFRQHDTSNHSVSAHIGHLKRGTKYCFKLVLWSSEPRDTTYYLGQLRTFKTAGPK